MAQQSTTLMKATQSNGSQGTEHSDMGNKGQTHVTVFEFDTPSNKAVTHLHARVGVQEVSGEHEPHGRGDGLGLQILRGGGTNGNVEPTREVHRDTGRERMRWGTGSKDGANCVGVLSMNGT